MRSDRSHGEPLLGVGDARVLDALADGERLRERVVRERRLVVGEVRLAPDLSSVRLAPGVLAFGMRRQVERFASDLDGFRWVRSGERDARQRDGEGRPERDRLQRPGFTFGKLGTLLRHLLIDFDSSAVATTPVLLCF